MSTTVVTVLVGPLLLLGPATDPTPPPVAPDAERSVVLCEERIPLLLDRIDLLQERIDAGATVAASTASLERRVERAESSGRALLADRLRDRLERRPLLVEQLDEAESRITAVRDARCGS